MSSRDVGGLACRWTRSPPRSSSAAAAARPAWSSPLIQVVTLPRSEGVAFLEEHLRAVAERRLIASVTSEVGVGGKVIAATPEGEGRSSFVQAPTVSYGEYADDLLTTLRRAPLLSYQVLGVIRPTSTSSMSRAPGTRSACAARAPGVVSATFGDEQVLPTPYALVGPETMLPVTHILWSHLWLGIATDAFDRARARGRAPHAGRCWPRAPPVPAHTANCCAEVADCAYDDDAGLVTMRFNNLKLASSALRVCQGAMGVTGRWVFKRHAVQRRAPPARCDVGLPDDRQPAHRREQRGACS